MRHFSAAALALCVAACASTGVRIMDEQLTGLKAGETTEAAVVAKLGAPTMRTRLGDGSVTLIYTYAEAKVRPATMIPFAGAFVGGTDVRSNSVTLRFGADGKLIDTASSSSTYGAGTGAAAGQAAAEPTQQPRQ